MVLNIIRSYWFQNISKTKTKALPVLQKATRSGYEKTPPKNIYKIVFDNKSI